MLIKSIKGLKLGQTSYLLIEDSEAILIDCGFDISVLRDYLTQNNIKLLGVFLTHGHFDHALAGAELQNEGINIYASEFSDKITTTGYDLGRFLRTSFTRFSASYKLKDGDIVEIGSFTVKAFYTPGHTVDGMCYLINGVLFSGDTLLTGSYGRVDLPTASSEDMKKSIRRLFTFDIKMPVCSGHESVKDGVNTFLFVRNIGDYISSQDIAYFLNTKYEN